MAWRRAAKAVDAGNDNSTTIIGGVSIENRILNVRSARERTRKAIDEMIAAIADHNKCAADLANALNTIDASIRAEPETITIRDVLDES